MKSQNSKHQGVDPLAAKFSNGDNSPSSQKSNAIDAPEDKTMPSQSGGNQSKGGGEDTDAGLNKFLTNEKKYGGKPPGDESIANRGVTHVNPDKSKAI